MFYNRFSQTAKEKTIIFLSIICLLIINDTSCRYNKNLQKTYRQDIKKFRQFHRSPHTVEQFHAHEQLTVCLMVKNEEKNIIQTLKPFVLSGIESFFIYDTGSDDKTITFAKNFLLKHPKVKYIIAQEKFEDFSTSRNRALRLAEKYFKNNKFIIMPDAEWYISNAKFLPKICIELEKSTNSCFLIKITDSKVDFYVPRLFKAHKNINFTGSVHEIPDKPCMSKLPVNIYFNYKPSTLSRERSKKRWQRDKYLLLKDYKKNPHEPRTLFFLGQTYAALGDWIKARDFFEKRIKIIGNAEENFIALYRLAQVTEILAQSGQKIYWSIALEYYLQAYNLRPWRIEPLYEVSRYYFNCNQLQTAKLFIDIACRAKYPHNDVIFVDKAIYKKNRFLLRKKIREKLR